MCAPYQEMLYLVYQYLHNICTVKIGNCERGDVIIKLIYKGYTYQCSSTVLPKGTSLVQGGFTLIRGCPFHSRPQVGTLGEETFGYNCTPG